MSAEHEGVCPECRKPSVKFLTPAGVGLWWHEDVNHKCPRTNWGSDEEFKAIAEARKGKK